MIADEDSVKVVEVSVSESRPLAVRSVLYFTMVCWLVGIIISLFLYHRFGADRFSDGTCQGVTDSARGRKALTDRADVT